MTTKRLPPRGGMTLIEVMIALVIVTGVTLGMGSYVTRFSHSTTDASVRSTAGDLVADRLEQIKGYGVYETLEATYAGAEATIPGFPRFSRQTQIQRVNNLRDDYKIVTVTVTNPALPSPVKKSTVISSF